EIILSGILPVVLPYLSDIKRRGGDILPAYIYSAELITGVVWPILAVGSVASLPAIRLMFGDQWDAAAPIASIVAFWGVFRAGHILAPQALLSIGEESALMRKELLVFLIFIVSIISGYLLYGLIGVSYAFV